MTNLALIRDRCKLPCSDSYYRKVKASPYIFFRSFLYFFRMRVIRVLLLSLVVLLSGCASLSSLSIQGADELSRRTSLPTSEDNTVRILSGGQDFYSSLLKDLNAAREYVCAEYYSIENDEVGRALMDSLASCAWKVQSWTTLTPALKGFGTPWLKKNFITGPKTGPHPPQAVSS